MRSPLRTPLVTDDRVDQDDWSDTPQPRVPRPALPPHGEIVEVRAVTSGALYGLAGVIIAGPFAR